MYHRDSITRTLASYITDGLFERSTTELKKNGKEDHEAANKIIGASQVIFKARTDKPWITTHALL